MKKFQIENYKPLLKAKHIKGLSVPCVIVDYKTKRSVELMSQAEKYVWYMLRFDDQVKEIYEQFRLDLDITLEIANKYKIKHPKDNFTPMTTDFFVVKDFTFIAYSVKESRSVLLKKRNIEKLFLEMKYWEWVGVEFHIVFKEDLNMILVQNIMDICACYDKENVHTEYDLIRHKIAHKELQIDLAKESINYKKLMEEK